MRAPIEKACDAKDASGCAWLGWAKERGLGATKDASAAAELEKRACDAGDADGCALVAKAALQAKDAKGKDDARATLTKLCDAPKTPSAVACGALAESLATSPKKDDKKHAAELAKKACDLGELDACPAPPKTKAPTGKSTAKK